jgi:hypothetical protein
VVLWQWLGDDARWRGGEAAVDFQEETLRKRLHVTQRDRRKKKEKKTFWWSGTVAI